VDISKLIILVKKDILVEVRRRYEVLSTLAFISAAALLIGEISTQYLDFSIGDVSIWVIMIFIAIFMSTSTFIREADKKTIYGVRLIPISPSLVFIAKLLYTFIFVSLESLFYILLIYLFTSKSTYLDLETFIVFIVVSLNISAVSAFSSALSMYSEGRSLLIPMLIFIFTIPIIPVAVRIAGEDYIGGLMDYIFLIGETLSFIATSTILSTYLLE